MGRKNIEIPIMTNWNPDSAYILGFWWADGHIGQNKRGGDYLITFSSNDQSHLELIADILDLTGKVRKCTDSNCYTLAFSRKSMYNFIVDNGGIPAKSLKATWHNVSEKYLCDFVRGYIDGDGSLFWDKSVPILSICGTSDFLYGMAEQIYENTGIYSPNIYQHKDKIPFIKYSGLKAKLLTYWLYNESRISLQRKRDIASLFLQWKPKNFGYKKRVITPLMRDIFEDLL